MVATTIELGNFLISPKDLTRDETDMIGFGQIDINNNGTYENVYIGNAKENKMFTKEAALQFAISKYNTYSILSKKVENKNYKDKNDQKYITIYAISSENREDGWTKVNKSSVPDDALIASNTEYAMAVYNLNMNALVSKYKEAELKLFMQ